MTDLLRPSLRRYPDARKAPFPLIDPLLFPYLGLLFGVPVVALVASVNALAVRRWALFFVSLLLGFAGWIFFFAAAGNSFVVARGIAFAVGMIFYVAHRPYARGHVFLRGRVAPLLATYMTVFVVYFTLPENVLLILMGVSRGR